MSIVIITSLHRGRYKLEELEILFRGQIVQIDRRGFKLRDGTIVRLVTPESCRGMVADVAYIDRELEYEELFPYGAKIKDVIYF